MPKKMPNTAASPYTGFRFMLDVSGKRGNFQVRVPCSGCGELVDVGDDETGHHHCFSCAQDCRTCHDLGKLTDLLANFWDDNDKTIEVDGREYGFFANVWWLLNNNFTRVHQVRNEEILSQLKEQI